MSPFFMFEKKFLGECLVEAFLQNAIDWLNQHDITVVALILSFVLAAFRSFKATGRIDWIEAAVCGCLTLAVSSTLEYLNLPSQLAIFLGGLIGFKGSLWIDGWINKKVDK